MIRGFARVLVAAAAAGAALALGGSATAGTRDKELSLPGRVGPYVTFADAKINRHGPGLALAKKYVGFDRKSAELLSHAYDGAAAGARRYTDERLDNMFYLLVVRAPSPGLFVPYEDAKLLDLARPPDEVRTFGDVECQLLNDPTVRGGTPARDSVHVLECRRSDAKLTVSIVRVAGRLGNSPAAVASLVDEAWKALR